MGLTQGGKTLEDKSQGVGFGQTTRSSLPTAFEQQLGPPWEMEWGSDREAVHLHGYQHLPWPDPPGQSFLWPPARENPKSKPPLKKDEWLLPHVSCENIRETLGIEDHQRLVAGGALTCVDVCFGG